MVGWQLQPWQSGALTLDSKETILLSSRQIGKSVCLSLVSVWTAFRKPAQSVLIVSANDVAAMELLARMRTICSHELLAGSVVDENQHKVELSNGSVVRSVPASDGAIRGKTTDLLVIDEAAQVADALIAGAAIPTTMARPDSRIILASSPFGAQGEFFRRYSMGLDPLVGDVASFRWRMEDAPWITAATLEYLRRTLPPLRYQAEVLGEFVGAMDAYFDPADLIASVADFPMTRDGNGRPAYLGLDWGRMRDSHAVVVAGVADDFAVNGVPVVIVAWLETSARAYRDQVTEVTALAGLWDIQVLGTECNGVGAAPSEDVARALPNVNVRPVHTSMRSKEDAYGRVATLLASRQLVLPNDETLLRQLHGIAASPVPSGLRIAARDDAVHDDLPDALSLAVSCMPVALSRAPQRDIPDGMSWVETAAGVKIPVPVATTAAELSWRHVWGETTECARCHRWYVAGRGGCNFCGGPGRMQSHSGAPQTNDEFAARVLTGGRR